MAKGIKTVKQGITEQIKAMSKRASALDPFIQSQVMRMVMNAQTKRWITQNRSEGTEWSPLNPDYAKRKLKQYANYPGGGRKILIATGALFESVTKFPPGFKIVYKNTLTLFTPVPYAKYVDEARTFTTWSPNTRKRINTAVSRFVFKNIRGTDL